MKTGLKNENIVFENSNGETIRYIKWRTNKLFAVVRADRQRIEFVDNLIAFENEMKLVAEQNEATPAAKRDAFQLITVIERSNLRIKPISIGAFGRLRMIENTDAALLKKDVTATKEDNSKFVQFIGYSSLGHVAALALVLISAWVMHRFFEKAPQAVTVQVFEQHIEEAKANHQVVDMAEHKINQQNLKNKTVTAKVTSKHVKIRRDVVATSTSAKGHGNSSRPGTSMQNSGALGVLGGGMGTQYHGSGGLNVNAKHDGPGIGYGGPAMRGGFTRGLLGKGLIATGIGNGQGNSLQGYGGTASSGLGGGRPGYGTMHMAGSAGAYFEPLGEESLIEGGLDRDQINTVIQRNIGQVTYCYEQGLQANPDLSGRVAVKFVIGSRGAVESAKVANTSVGSQRVESCIVSKLRGWKFPQPTGNVSVRVTYPFVLKRLSEG